MTFSARLLTLLRDRWPELVLRLGQHLQLIGLSLFLATIFGVGLGLSLSSRPKLARLALTAANIIQTIPSLALLAFLLPLLGIGTVPALCALTLYAVMPILRSMLSILGEENTGLSGIGTALGLTPAEVVRYIKLPQGLPFIVSGLRTAAVWSVGTATLSAFIGAGGLGEFINRGISLLDPALLLFGAVPATLLALTIDALLGGLESDSIIWKQGHHFPGRKWLVILVLTGIGIVFVESLSTWINPYTPRTESIDKSVTPVRIGTKNFAEQLVLGELLAQYLESHGVPVQRPLPTFQSTDLIHGALMHDDIDLYVEYLGTAAQVILKLPTAPGIDPTTEVRAAYAQEFQEDWLDGLGFSNTYAVVTRTEIASGTTNLSQFAARASKLHAGLNSEFIERPDGLPALEKTYDLHFGRIDTLDAGLLYTALANGRVDVIVGFSTDPQLTQPGLLVVADNQNAFPRYDAVPVVSEAVSRAYPRLEPLLRALAGHFNEATMRGLNAEVELHYRSPEDVARDYWLAHPMP